LLASLWLRECDVVGGAASLLGRPFVMNRGRMEIGERLLVSSVPVRSHFMTGPSGLLRIGRGVRIGHGASINAHAEISIGDETVIGPFAMILDVDFHEVKDRAARGLARPVRIGRGVRIGAGVVILRGASIGDGAEIAPNSVVSRHVPTGARAAGVPARPVEPCAVSREMARAQAQL
jgi:maltose O-acetyltransferase